MHAASPLLSPPHPEAHAQPCPNPEGRAQPEGPTRPSLVLGVVTGPWDLGRRSHGACVAVARSLRPRPAGHSSAMPPPTASRGYCKLQGHFSFFIQRFQTCQAMQPQALASEVGSKQIKGISAPFTHWHVPFSSSLPWSFHEVSPCSNASLKRDDLHASCPAEQKNVTVLRTQLKKRQQVGIC